MTISQLWQHQDRLTAEVLASLADLQAMELRHEQIRRESQAEVMAALDAAFDKIFQE